MLDAIFGIIILFGIISLLAGIWCMISQRDKKYKERREEFLKQKLEVQIFIKEQRRHIKNECN